MMIGTLLQPWSVPTAMLSVHLVEALPFPCDLKRLQSELDDVTNRFASSLQMGPHHDGNWTRIGLLGPSGDHSRSYGRRGEAISETAALQHMPSVRELLQRFEGSVKSAILSRMGPGGYVRWHRDLRQSADRKFMRLHLPLVTNEDCTMEIGHERVHLAAGQLWYSDFTFPHRVFNRSQATRTHLMIDVASNGQTRGLLPERYWREAGRRRVARKLSASIFDATELLHKEGRYAARFRADRHSAAKRGEAFSPETVGMHRKTQA